MGISLEVFILLTLCLLMWIIILGSIFSPKSAYSHDRRMERKRLGGRKTGTGWRAGAVERRIATGCRDKDA